jgi:hypothetical protein
MPGFIKDINYLSPLKYTVAAVAVQAFRGAQFTCTSSQRLPDGSCPISTGDQVLQLYNLDSMSIPVSLAALAGATAIYRLLAYTILKATRLHLDVVTKEKEIAQKVEGSCKSEMADNLWFMAYFINPLVRCRFIRQQR